MIESLQVKDYVLFDQARLDFQNNMAVITGETGAGKSLLIDAIDALSGSRVNSSWVRKGKDKAVLTMVISGLSDEVKALLEENGIDAEDELIITRIIQAAGKSRTLINSTPSTNAFAAKLTSMLIDVHSQMDTTSLLDPALQLELLDRYAKDQSELEAVDQAYKEWRQISAKLRKLQNETFSDDQLEFITTQLNEIQAAAVREGELEQLETAVKEAAGAQKNIEDFSSALYYWNKEQGIQDQLSSALKVLRKNEKAQKQSDALHDLYYALMNEFEEISDLKNAASAGSENLDAMQERLYSLKRLFRKYGGSYEALKEKEASLNEMVDRILHRQDLFDRLEKEQKEAWKAYASAAKVLSEKRKSVTQELREKIEGHARDLMLEHCQFEIRFSKGNPSAKGSDEIEFYASMNPGMPLSPLKQSASGGELSRLMLALKVVFQAQNGISTLVFDEIDTGVSGKVALAMGSKMHALAENYQVLCITHLPSVAVWADDHFTVSKSSDDSSTTASVSLLDDEQHFEELAIMAHGSASQRAVESMKELAAAARHG